MKWVVAFLMAFLAAIGLSILAALVVGGGEGGGTLAIWSFILGLVALTALFGSGAVGPLSAFRRGLATIAVEAFLTPLTALIFTIVASSKLATERPPGTETEAAGAAIGAGLVGFVGIGVGVVIAIVIGIPALVVYAVTKPSTSPPGAPPPTTAN